MKARRHPLPELFFHPKPRSFATRALVWGTCLLLSAATFRQQLLPARPLLLPHRNNRSPAGDSGANCSSASSAASPEESSQDRPLDASQQSTPAAADPTRARQRRITASPFFDALEKHNPYPPTHWSNRTLLSADSVCGDPGGRGIEGERGWELLTRKVRLWKSPPEEKRMSAKRGGEESSSRNASSWDSLYNSPPPELPTLFCGVYTVSDRRDLVRVVAASYGAKCDGFAAFSNETIEDWGIVRLPHDGPESYFNMWHKVQAIWEHIAAHYPDYDYYHLGGDDMYVLVDNLKYFLRLLDLRLDNPDEEPVFVGQWVRQKQFPYVSGGPGYTLNRAAVQRLAPAIRKCFPEHQVPYEDRLLALCLRQLGIYPKDSRDTATAEQLYHDVPPQQVFEARSGATSGKKRATFHSRGLAYWETLPPPPLELDPSRVARQQQRIWQGNLTEEATSNPVGPKHGLDAAGRFSVSFHRLHSPQYMARIHALVYHLCPADTPLGRSLAEVDLYASVQ